MFLNFQMRKPLSEAKMSQNFNITSISFKRVIMMEKLTAWRNTPGYKAL